MINKVFLIGNLCADPELKETPSGVSVCRFKLAVSRSYTNENGQRDVDFFSVTAWRGLGETIAKYCKKGHKISLIGSIQLRSYEDNEGVKRTAVDVIASEVEFLTPKSSNEEQEAPSKKPTLVECDDDSDIPF